MRPLTDMIKGGYLYRRIEVKYDVVGLRYKMCVRRFWIDFYTRRTNSPYVVCYKDLNIFISTETPLVKKAISLGQNSVISKLESGWEDVFDYAIDKAETSWITYSESDKYMYDPAEKDGAIFLLDVTSEEFEKIRKLSPYS